MFDKYTEAFAFETTINLNQLVQRLLISAIYGGLVAGIYRWSHGRNRPDSIVLVSTLMLLSVLIAMVSMVIGESVARAFSLVGALSIVRFRTVVEDTRDTAFVIFAVIVGMAAGAGLIFVPLIGIPLVGLIAFGLSASPAKLGTTSALASYRLVVRLGLGRDADATLNPLLTQHLQHYHLQSVETAKQGTSLDLTYHVELLPTSSMPRFVAELNQVEGVQSVEMQFTS